MSTLDEPILSEFRVEAPAIGRILERAYDDLADIGPFHQAAAQVPKPAQLDPTLAYQPPYGLLANPGREG